MSEEKKTPAKNANPGKGQRILHWFKTLPQRIARPFKNMHYELKKVTWPTKERLISYSCIVLVFMLFMGVVIGLLDMGASAAVRGLVNLRANSPEVASVVEDVEDAVDGPVEDAVAAVEDAAVAAGDAVKDAAESVEKGVEDAANAVDKAVVDAADAVKDAAEQAEKGVEDAAVAVGDAVKDAAESVEKAVTGEDKPAETDAKGN